MLRGIDVRSVLGSVQAPTLVLAIIGSAIGHPTGARGGRTLLAERIPGARYVELRRHDLIMEHTDPGLLLDEIERSVRSVSTEEAEIDRVLATVLFTDIVGSTDKAVELGDRRVA